MLPLETQPKYCTNKNRSETVFAYSCLSNWPSKLEIGCCKRFHLLLAWGIKSYSQTETSTTNYIDYWSNSQHIPAMQTNGSMFVIWCTSTLKAKHIIIILKSWVYYTMMHMCMQAGCVQVNLLHKLCISTCELHDFVLFGMSIVVIHWRLC